MSIASDGVNSVSGVPWRISVGTLIRLTSALGPRDANHARSWADRLPPTAPLANADVMCGSSRPVACPAA